MVILNGPNLACSMVDAAVALGMAMNDEPMASGDTTLMNVLGRGNRHPRNGRGQHEASEPRQRHDLRS